MIYNALYIYIYIVPDPLVVSYIPRDSEISYFSQVSNILM